MEPAAAAPKCVQPPPPGPWLSEGDGSGVYLLATTVLATSVPLMLRFIVCLYCWQVELCRRALAALEPSASAAGRARTALKAVASVGWPSSYLAAAMEEPPPAAPAAEAPPRAPTAAAAVLAVLAVPAVAVPAAAKREQAAAKASSET